MKYTKKQINKAISFIDSENKGLSGVRKPTFEVLTSPYSDDIFLKEEKIEIINEYPGEVTLYHQVKQDGTLIKDVATNLEFQTLADRVHFFNSLKPLKVK